MGVQLNVVYDKSFCVEDLISVELESEGETDICKSKITLYLKGDSHVKKVIVSVKKVIVER